MGCHFEAVFVQQFAAAHARAPLSRVALHQSEITPPHFIAESLMHFGLLMLVTFAV
jgi:hypothetical protein